MEGNILTADSSEIVVRIVEIETRRRGNGRSIPRVFTEPEGGAFLKRNPARRSRGDGCLRVER